MRIVLQLLIMAMVFAFAAPLSAEQPGASAPTAEIAADSREKTGKEEAEGQDKGWSGMTIFLLVFIFSVLFVVHSATALSRFEGKRPPPGAEKPHSGKKKEDKEEQARRFRL